MTRFEIDYTKSDMKAFFDDISKKKLLKSLIWMYSIIGTCIFLIFVSVTFFMSGSFSFSRPLPFVFLGVLILLVLWAVLQTLKKAPEKMYAKFSESYDGSTVVCVFDSDRLYINSINTNETESTENFILYSDLEKAVETDNYFYVFINPETAQIIRKSAVTEGSIEEVKTFLKTSFGEKYEDITKLR